MIDIPRQPSPQLFNIQQWPKAAFALHLSATSGSSVRYEIAESVGRQFGITPDCGSMARMFKQLNDLDLTITQDFSIVHRLHLAGIRLSTSGKKYCESLGWPVVENEWERLLRLHCADTQIRHTGAVMAFAYQARRHGWKIQVLPQTGIANFYPDAVVEKGDERHYVEVELGTRKQGKWLLALRCQGYVALCARTPIRRASLINECIDVGVYGIANDLLTLAKSDARSPLWTEKWTVEDNFSYVPK